MKIKEAIEKGFKLFPDGQWRIKKIIKDKNWDVWQRWNFLKCGKCGDDFLAAHKDVKTCGHRCAILGEKRALGVHYERPRDYRVIRDGYSQILDKTHGNANNIGRVLEHRYIISNELGRPLFKTEHVHHINGNKLDNRRKNLVLLTVSEHMSVHNHQKIMKRDTTNGRFLKMIGVKNNHH